MGGLSPYTSSQFKIQLCFIGVFMGLYIQDRQINDKNNNSVFIDPVTKIVTKKFHDPEQYQQEIQLASMLEPFSIAPKLISYSRFNRQIKYDYIETKQITQPEKIKLLRKLHGLELANFSLPKSYQIQSIENRIKSCGCQVSEECLIHGDPTPDNFLKGDDQRLYLIDFEEACFSDPLIDLTIFIIENSNVESSKSLYEIEQDFLSEYDPNISNRFYHIRKDYYQACLLTLEKWWNENNKDNNLQYLRFRERMVSL